MNEFLTNYLYLINIPALLYVVLYLTLFVLWITATDLFDKIDDVLWDIMPYDIDIPVNGMFWISVLSLFGYWAVGPNNVSITIVLALDTVLIGSLLYIGVLVSKIMINDINDYFKHKRGKV